MGLNRHKGDQEEVEVLVPGGRKVRATVRNGRVLMPKPASTVGAKRGFRSTRKGVTTLPIKSLEQSSQYSPDAVTRRVIEVPGNNTVAGLLGVSNDRPSRWATGSEAPSEENRAPLADLDSMLGQLLTVFTAGQAALWLNGHDPFLNARPIDVYRIEGAGPVIEAMKAYEQGAFA